MKKQFTLAELKESQAALPQAALRTVKGGNLIISVTLERKLDTRVWEGVDIRGEFPGIAPRGVRPEDQQDVSPTFQ